MTDEHEETEAEKNLRRALKQCRDLLDQTEKLIDRAKCVGGPKKKR